MCKMHGMTLWIALLLIATGCGKEAGTGQSSATPKASEPTATAANSHADPAAQPEGPAAAVTEFLEAVRTGNDEVATQMLSSVARQKMAALNRSVTPPASDTAKFTVGKIDYVGDDGARVACTWTDLDPDGQPKTDDVFWVVRHEATGWRIAGMAQHIFPGEPPLLLNFEEPEDMFKKLQWAREESLRRAEKEETGLQAQGGEKPEKPVRR